MTKLLIFLGGTAGSYLGWWIGETIAGVMGALAISTVVGCLGIYAGWKIGNTYF